MADPISTPALLDGGWRPRGGAAPPAILWAASLATACGLYGLVILVSAGCEREAGRVADATRAGGAPLGIFVALAAGHGRPRR